MEKRPGWCQGACLEFYVILKVCKLFIEINFFINIDEIIIGFALYF